MSSYYTRTAWGGYEGAKTKRSTAFTLLSHAK